jgi:hypothetical protein
MMELCTQKRTANGQTLAREKMSRFAFNHRDSLKSRSTIALDYVVVLLRAKSH